jgi:DNA-binding PadR family transcriptional regulator
MTAAENYDTATTERKVDAKSAVIYALTVNGECSKWDLKGLTKMHYSTCFKAVKSLKKEGLIRVVQADKISQKGQRIKTYNLTIEGLINFLSRLFLFESLTKQKHVEQIIDKIAKLHAETLPLVLGKWDLFEKGGIKDVSMKTLLLTASQHWQAITEQKTTIQKLRRRKVPEKDIENLLLWSRWFLEGPIIMGRPDLAQSFTEYFYRIRLIIPDPDIQKKWLQTIANDSEVRFFVLVKLIKAEKAFRSEVDLNAEMIRYLQNARQDSVSKGS